MCQVILTISVEEGVYSPADSGEMMPELWPELVPGERTGREKFLGYLYHLWTEEQEGTQEQICGVLGSERASYEQLRDGLIADSLIAISGGGFALTQKGLEEVYQLQQNQSTLYTFLRNGCSVTELSARQNAIRMSRIVSADAIDGIRAYVMRRRNADRVIRGEDLKMLYEPGEYRFDMSLYDARSYAPRILCKEHTALRPDIILEVTESQSRFRVSPKADDASEVLWYLQEQKWMRAPFAEGSYLLPTDCFVYTITSRIPLTSGEAFVALVPEDRELGEEDIRALEVHLW